MARYEPPTYPHFAVDVNGHAVRRFDSVDDEGTIIAFCQKTDDAYTIVSALSYQVEHAALIGLLNGTHGILREIQEKLYGPDAGE